MVEVYKVVTQYILDHHLNTVKKGICSKGDFELHAASKWAANKALNAVKNSSSPLKALMELANKYEKYACVAKTDTAKFVFAVAYDTITDILCCIM